MKKSISILLLLGMIAIPVHVWGQKARHVIVIGCDAFAAYAYPKADIPNIRKLASKGALSLKARCVLPSSSAVNWASMLMGSGPTMHGYTEWGSKTPEIPSAVTTRYGMYPTIYSVIREQMPQANLAAIYSWDGIGYLFEKEAVNTNICTKANEELTADTAAYIIRRDKPLFMFVHFDQPDGAGHKFGHRTKEYYDELHQVDRRIGKIITAVEDAGIAGNTVFIVLGDHGGINKGHGGKTTDEVEITWLISGAGTKQNYTVKSPLIIYDTAPTIAWIFGLEQPDSWRGKALTEAFK